MNYVLTHYNVVGMFIVTTSACYQHSAGGKHIILMLHINVFIYNLFSINGTVLIKSLQWIRIIS